MLAGTLLVAVILVTFSVAATAALLQFSPQGTATIEIRAGLIRHPSMRQLFNLHSQGDAHSDYLGAGTNRIVLQVYETPSQPVAAGVLSGLAARAESATGKLVTVNVATGELPDVVATSEAQRDAMLAPYNPPIPSMGEATMDVFIMGEDSDAPDEIGLTYRDDGIILFNGTLAGDLAHSPQTVQPYQTSTLLHEFGHQLGLQHNTQPGCVMNPSADITDSLSVQAQDVVTNFCPYELGQINALR